MRGSFRRVPDLVLGRRAAVISAADWRAPLEARGAARVADTGIPADGPSRGTAAGTGIPADGARPPAADDTAADLGRAMALLTAFRYRRGDEATPPDIEPDALTRALDAGIAHVARLRWRALAPVRRVEGWADAARREWTRLTSEAPWTR